MDRAVIPLLPSGPSGAAGLSSLHALQYNAKNLGTQRQTLARVCAEVEGVFISQLLQQMRKTMVTSADPRQKHTDYLHLYETQVAQALAAGGGIGLARRLFEDLQNRLPATPKENQNDASRTADPAPSGDFPVPGTFGMSGTGSPSPGNRPGGDHPEPGRI